MSEIDGKPKKNSRIFHKSPKIRKSFKARISPYFPKALLKRFLRWLKLRDASGELLVKEDTLIDRILEHWIKESIHWLFGIIITGFLIYCATLVFWPAPNAKEIIVRIISYGIAAFILTKIFEAFKKMGISIANSLPKHNISIKR